MVLPFRGAVDVGRLEGGDTGDLGAVEQDECASRPDVGGQVGVADAPGELGDLLVLVDEVRRFAVSPAGDGQFLAERVAAGGQFAQQGGSAVGAGQPADDLPHVPTAAHLLDHGWSSRRYACRDLSACCTRRLRNSSETPDGAVG
jgi:hypothetical protein